MATVTAPAASDARQTGPKPPPKPRFGVGRALGWAFMILVMIVSLFPFYWILRTALSDNNALYAGGDSLLPVQFSWGGFERVFGIQTGQEAIDAGGAGQPIAFWRYLLNSVLVATMVTAGQVFFSAMAAYAFARLRWRHREQVFAVFLAGLMIPAIFTLLPNFVLIKELGLVDTVLGIALPSMLMTPFAVFFLRQFFLGISREVEEAAMVEGASKTRIFFRLILPISAAPISTLSILTYITSWNEYFWPLMVSYTDRSRVLTVALGVFKSQKPQAGPDWAGLMAATLVAALPMLLLFLVFARRIVNSIGFSGIK
ncbi:carbohydrate ABC transporter permease [Nonomuraea gerenzanensis]|uniref:N-Acetyl-D-glucosamine ABC transport system, permease protein 2 n=1 Tax=Nonomuraea gerenzanensis TaxID=93944 RepID=A0A1M4E5S0_9ACTN|nr:carbohydrate ABC transporter permease [Nonomuraea gerenzanensis]UBU16294.1 carbohydrate ABC transporter permease [Nonomuraea gerenzanensis]SBO94108.1 N-Acetyl-D-glucosamine ABC transport system, permease protein 2 [Nonomuraea gerenzanensis]